MWLQPQPSVFMQVQPKRCSEKILGEPQGYNHSLLYQPHALRSIKSQSPCKVVKERASLDLGASPEQLIPPVFLSQQEIYV
jgi:hypothetical protein